MVNIQEAGDLVLAYVKKKFSEQLKSIAFIVTYLFLFQSLILSVPISELSKIGFGIFLVTFGLTLFMEGLILGLMPIGESLGVKLPAKLAIIFVLIFSFILGIGATFAEPAIGVLRAMGENVAQAKAPLLHYILNQKSEELVLAVGVGVGVAVLFGVLRFLYNWSLKKMIIPLVLICLGITSYGLINENFLNAIGLAWDCGAVTTGPVTVPLVLSLGLGISRVVTGNSKEGLTSGFGVVTLASLMPVVAVLILSLYYQLTVDFNSLPLLPKVASSLNGTNLNLSNLLNAQWVVVKNNFIIAARAILPLCLFMLFVFRVILREKFQFLDEIILGIILSLVGMTFFNIGIEYGLGNLGKQVGRALPSAYSSIKLKNESRIIANFDLNSVQTRYTDKGEKEQFFYLEKNNKTATVLFHPNSYNKKNKTYVYTPEYGPLWGQEKISYIGIFIVLVFAFLMGYGATLAEPALNTLGATVEDISVGTFKKSLLIQTVAIGVGFGLLLGITKVIWHISLIWLIIPPYLILLFLTAISSEDFVNIAWDSAGVTTGPITVPLVLAMGLGIGGQSGAIEGFGILAMASVCPVMTVLAMGLIVNKKREKILKEDSISEVSNA